MKSDLIRSNSVEFFNCLNQLIPSRAQSSPSSDKENFRLLLLCESISLNPKFLFDYINDKSFITLLFQFLFSLIQHSQSFFQQIAKRFLKKLISYLEGIYTQDFFNSPNLTPFHMIIAQFSSEFVSPQLIHSAFDEIKKFSSLESQEKPKNFHTFFQYFRLFTSKNFLSHSLFKEFLIMDSHHHLDQFLSSILIE
jgi:hypothetical protein